RRRLFALAGRRARRRARSSAGRRGHRRRGAGRMTDPDRLFCKVLRGELPSTEVNRTDGFVAIEDINPKADVHLLVIPERHLVDFREIGVLSADDSKRMLEFVADTAKKAGLEEYRVMNFCGPGA